MENWIKVLLGVMIGMFLYATIDYAKAEDNWADDSWKRKEDLLPPPSEDDKFRKDLPLNNEYIIMDKCFSKGEVDATIQIARILEPDLTRQQHFAKMTRLLQHYQFIERVIIMYQTEFDYVWDTFPATMEPGRVHWIAHNECIAKEREKGNLPPLTEDQQKEWEDIQERMWKSHIGVGFTPVVTPELAIAYCDIFSEHVVTTVVWKRMGYTQDEVAAKIVDYWSEEREEYINHWMKVIDYVYSNDYEYRWEWKLYSGLDCKNFFDENEEGV